MSLTSHDGGSAARDPHSAQLRTELGRRRLDDLYRFASRSRCRRATLLGFFDEDDPGRGAIPRAERDANCGACDMCLRQAHGAWMMAGQWSFEQHALLALQATKASRGRFGKAFVVDLLMGKAGVVRGALRGNAGLRDQRPRVRPRRRCRAPSCPGSTRIPRSVRAGASRRPIGGS